ncbi:MAG: sugar transferase [Anaerolineales bacterium]|nr:sugar transferase [Anaerolineales bacterium]
MGSLHIASVEKRAWIKNFDPEKRIVKGPAYILAKRIFDLFLLTVSLPLWLPLLLVTSFLIWLTAPGAPVIFFQLRTGKNGKRFRMFKFRTMVPNAEELKTSYAHLNELKWPDFKITNDPRITFIGRILRKTSLDELPQLLNVLLGDMSLVGPRPTSFSADTYELWQTERLDVVPGMTGLWQIEGRGRLEFDQRLRLDIAYIERSSLWLDIVILFRTIIAVFERRGAH